MENLDDNSFLLDTKQVNFVHVIDTCCVVCRKQNVGYCVALGKPVNGLVHVVCLPFIENKAYYHLQPVLHYKRMSSM